MGRATMAQKEVALHLVARLNDNVQEARSVLQDLALLDPSQRASSPQFAALENYEAACDVVRSNIRMGDAPINLRACADLTTYLSELRRMNAHAASINALATQQVAALKALGMQFDGPQLAFSFPPLRPATGTFTESWTVPLSNGNRIEVTLEVQPSPEPGQERWDLREVGIQRPPPGVLALHEPETLLRHEHGVGLRALLLPLIRSLKDYPRSAEDVLKDAQRPTSVLHNFWARAYDARLGFR